MYLPGTIDIPGGSEIKAQHYSLYNETFGQSPGHSAEGFYLAARSCPVLLQFNILIG
jgi:hypothetical protein